MRVIGAPELSIVVCTYERPRNLSACLASIARQEGVRGRFEVVVADDGSRDATPRLVEEFRRAAGFPVLFTTREHDGFRPARCRNDGARACRGESLLFVDGDCVLPPGHVRAHLDRRREGVVQGGDCLRLTEEQSEALVGSGGAVAPPRSALFAERWRVTRNHLDARLNGLLRNPQKPKLFAGDFSLGRRDLERVNGFDERYRDWGGEDDDLRARLLQAGLEVRSLRDATCSFHRWHPPDATAPKRWTEGRNVPRLKRRFRLTRCVDGLSRRRMEDLSIRVRNAARHGAAVAAAFPFLAAPAPDGGRVEVEGLFLPGPEGFTGDVDVRLLVLGDRVTRPPLDQADVLVTDLPDVRFDGRPRFRTDELPRVWEAIL